MEKFRLVAINVMVFISIVLVIEIIGQVVYLVRNGRILILEENYSTVFEPHPFLVGRPKASVTLQMEKGSITTTAENTRWTGAAESDDDLIRVALLGGSTVFGNGVTDEDTWPALLQEMLGDRYAVINYGAPGYTTAENIVQMALIVPAKRPHIVVFYEGWNDMKNYHEEELGTDYYAHGMKQRRALGTPDLARRSRDPRDTFAIAKMAQKLNQLISAPRTANYELFDTPDPFVDEMYVRNLKTLKLLADQTGAFTVFVPQVMNDSAYLTSTTNSGWSRHIRDEKFPELMARFNSLMAEICSPDEPDCIVLNDVLEEQWQPLDFIDRGHLSRRGGMKLATIVAEIIRAAPEIDEPVAAN